MEKETILQRWRIDKKEIEIIKRLAIQVFGRDTKVYLFGSRVNDNKKGGDIDLLISNDEKTKLSLEKKVEFLTELKYVIGDQKVDVVLESNTFRGNTQFYKSIKREAIEL